MELFALFQKGGPVMYLLLLCSISAVAIFIERLLFFRKASAGMWAFVEKLPLLLEGKTWSEAIRACRDEKCAPAFVAKEGLQAVAEGRDGELALENGYGMAAAKLRSSLNYLSMIVTLAPLLGLLGTIFGMINSFNIFSLKAGQPLAITGGIGEALIATATGLLVAILALIVHSYFSQKMDAVLTAMDSACAIVNSEFRKRRQGNAV